MITVLSLGAGVQSSTLALMAKHGYPLVERGIRRHNCIEWMKAKGYPEPPRSSCVFCPYHSDREWLLLKQESPEEFQESVEFEVRYQAAFAQTRLKGTPFLHRSLKPLSEVDFTAKQSPQSEMQFGMQNECEGMCGV